MFARKPYSSRHSKSPFPLPPSAFTLVELLVVIAIIGVLVALLLPAIQAAREAARRASCKNNLKNVALSILNHEESLDVLPTGGSHWGVYIEEYVENGQPLGPNKQGLGWMYQILPYLEQGALKGLITSPLLGENPVAIYNCPSRRGASPHGRPGYNGGPGFTSYLSDYTGVQPVSRHPVGLNPNTGEMTGVNPPNGVTRDFLVNLNTNGSFWQAKDFFYQYPGSNIVPDGTNDQGPKPQPGSFYDGAIVRVAWVRTGVNNRTGEIQFKKVGELINLSKVSDGTSNTMLVGEKWVRSDWYESGAPSDDTGWTDGWDPDAMRLSGLQPLPDSSVGARPGEFTQPWDKGPISGPYENFMFGSAHPGSFHMSFCDGSVQSINYEVDIYVFNSLGTRNGEESVSLADAGN